MAKLTKTDENYGDKEALERMNKALKGAMQKKPETHEEMVRRRQKASKKPKR